MSIYRSALTVEPDPTMIANRKSDSSLVSSDNFRQTMGRRKELSEVDIRKIKKLYKCPPFKDWKNGCTGDSECGVNEHCGISTQVEAFLHTHSE